MGPIEKAVVAVFGSDAIDLMKHAERCDTLADAFARTSKLASDAFAKLSPCDPIDALNAAAIGVNVYAFKVEGAALMDGLFLAAKCMGKLDALKAALKYAG